MKKVKVKIEFEVMVFIASALESLSQCNCHNYTDRLLCATYAELWLQLREKTIFTFTGEKKISLSVARAAALVTALQQLKTSNPYYQVNLLDILKQIDSQLA